MRVSVLFFLALAGTAGVLFPLSARAQESASGRMDGADDAMLAPLAEPTILLRSWEQARVLLRSRSVDWRIAALEVDKAAAQARTALAGFLPGINGTVNFTDPLITKTSLQVSGFDAATLTPTYRSSTTPPGEILSGNVTLSWLLGSVALWRQTQTAHRAVGVANLGVEETKRGIVINLASAVVAVFTAERVAELNRVGLRAALDRLSLTKKKLALGAATGLDVLRADQDVAAARATLVQGDESLRQAREALGLALGVPEAVGVSPAMHLDDLVHDGSLGRCTLEPLAKRADLVAARARTSLASRSIGDVKAEFLPALGVQSSIGTTSADTGVSPSTTWNLQAIFTVPIWDGGARYGKLRAAQANHEQAEQRYLGTERSATVQAAQATRSVEVAESSRVVAQEGRRLAAEADRLVRTAFTEGQGTSLELVTAAAQLRQAEVNLALREFELVRAKIPAFLAYANCEW